MSTGWFLIPIAGIIAWAVKISNPRLRVRLEFKPADCWIGFFYADRHPDSLRDQNRRHLWICLLPMLPLHLSWPR